MDFAWRDDRFPAAWFERSILTESGCWQQTGRLCKGYGRITWEGRRIATHRAAFVITHGPIPDGREIDHNCHNLASCTLNGGCPHRACWYPGHLRAVTHRVNVLAGTNFTARRAAADACEDGHELDVENTYWHQRRDGSWRRQCRKCRKRQAHECEERRPPRRHTATRA